MEIMFLGLAKLITWVISMAVYLLPSIIAHKKAHKQKLPIILVNVFLGWTLIGWIAALIWSCTKSTGTQSLVNGSAADEILKLNDLKERGIISEEDFAKKKSELLG